jgi:hypothetical protein
VSGGPAGSQELKKNRVSSAELSNHLSLSSWWATASLGNGSRGH